MTLKNKTIVVALLLISTIRATAQTTSIGPMLGTNITSFSELSNAAYLPGLSVGGFLNYSINEKFGINGKLLFSQYGTAYENSEVRTRLNYLQVPISGVYYFGQAGNRLRPKAYAGFYVGSLISGGTGTDASSVNRENDFTSLDAGGQIGLGFNYRVSPKTWLNAELGYTGGLVGVFDSQATNVRNRGFNLNVGLSFPVSK